MPTIALIVAVADNGVIGRNGQLPWQLPLDLKHFKQLSLGHPILMGRRTFESIGRPLPGRTNVVVTRQPDWSAPGCEVVHSLAQGLEVAATKPSGELICVIGGGEIYQAALPAADIVYLTEVHHAVPDGDAFFPTLPPAEWREEARERHEADDKHAFPFSFVTLRRR